MRCRSLPCNRGDDDLMDDGEGCAQRAAAGLETIELDSQIAALSTRRRKPATIASVVAIGDRQASFPRATAPELVTVPVFEFDWFWAKKLFKKVGVVTFTAPVEPEISKIKIYAGQRAQFLEHLAKSANVTASARVAGFDRSTAYQHRLADPEFAAQWEDALESSLDDLEGEARRRAYEGVAEPFVSMGRVVEVVDDEGKKSPLFVRKYSDTLMITLLKAHRASKFNPPPQVAGSSDALPAELQPDPVPTPAYCGSTRAIPRASC